MDSEDLAMDLRKSPCARWRKGVIEHGSVAKKNSAFASMCSQSRNEGAIDSKVGAHKTASVVGSTMLARFCAPRSLANTKQPGRKCAQA